MTIESEAPCVAPCTPRRQKDKGEHGEIGERGEHVNHPETNPRSPLLFIPSPARARTPKTPQTPEVRDLQSASTVKDSDPCDERLSKLSKLPQLSRLNANAQEFIPAEHVPTALRVREESNLKEPPVISVRKMASKGCAIVLLRSEHVIELAARMAVAVIDGVCVELRRHSRRSKRDQDALELGIFVAWGHRVERRATVSEEALEAYFNGLSQVSDPQALSYQPPFQESLLLFPLSSSMSCMSLKIMAPQLAEATGQVLLDGSHGRRDLVQTLWDAKLQLDELWNKPPPPKARSVMQRVARDQLFPPSGKEGKEGKEGSHENRAGEKLEELAQAVGLLDGMQPGVAGARFLDLCGGPGAWSQYLLQMNFQGFGFTLRSGVGSEDDWQAEQKDDWYPELLRHPNWHAIWGADGTGDLLKPENLQHASQILRAAGGVSICVADGGFSDKAIPPNLLELYFFRLFLAEVLTAANCLLPGGRFVCKLYSTFSASTSALLFLITRLFEDVRIVKPMSSRVAGPERYLYASGFRANEEAEVIKRSLWSCHVYGAGRSPLQLPLLTPLVVDLHKDAAFLPQLQDMVVTLCMRQAGALRAIRERAEELEEMALDVAEEAQAGAELWAEAAKKQRDERAERDGAKERERSERFEDRFEKLPNFSKPPLGRPTWKRPQVTQCKRRQSGLLSAEFNRWR